MTELTRKQITGGLFDKLAEQYCVELEQLKYGRATIGVYRRSIMRLGELMAENNVVLDALTPDSAAELVLGADWHGDRRQYALFVVRRFAAYLTMHGAGRLPAPPTPRELARAALRGDYEDYLRRQRGLSERTIGHCWRFADRFLDFRFGNTDIDLGAITPGDIVAFLQQLTTRQAPFRDKTPPTHLRNFFADLDDDLRQAGHRRVALDRATLAGRGRCAMSRLYEELDRYLRIRRSLGCDLKTTERVLRRFVAFAEKQGAEHISTGLFVKWQQSFGRASRQTWAARLGMVRLFAQWLQGLDAAHEVPPRGLLPYRTRRSRPYIYSADEIANIVATAAELPSIYGLRGLTFSTLFGLIATTGLRISEALALNADDVDLESDVLTIQRGKLGKARLVPIDGSVTQRLRAYAAERDRLLGFAPQSFFATNRGTRPDDCSARANFAPVCQRLGLRSRQRFHRHGRGPRIHDLRHTFAARTIIGWYRTGQDPAREMIKLMTYLGHTKPENTYWYIEAVPELLELATQRITGASGVGAHR